jgi:hypothetical protein
MKDRARHFKPNIIKKVRITKARHYTEHNYETNFACRIGLVQIGQWLKYSRIF